MNHPLMRILVVELTPTIFSDVSAGVELNFLSNVIDDDYCKYTPKNDEYP